MTDDTSMPASFVVRAATPEDLEALEAFIQPFVEQGRLLPRSTSELRTLSDDCYRAIVDGEIVGCAALEVYSRKLAEIRSLAVASHARRIGIGRKLVEACVEEARRQKILEVMAITSFEEFFKACGFDFTMPGEKKALFFQSR